MLFVSTASASSPEEITGKYYQLIQSNNWKEAVKLYDKGSLIEFKNSIIKYMNELPQKDSETLYSALFGKKLKLSDIPDMSEQDFFNGYFHTTRRRQQQLGKFKIKEFAVLGAVEEGKKYRHVVVRKVTDAQAYDIESYEVLSMVSIGSEWKLIPKPEVMALGKQMMQTLIARKKK